MSFQQLTDEIAALVPGIEVGMPVTAALELILTELKRLKALAGEAS